MDTLERLAGCGHAAAGPSDTALRLKMRIAGLAADALEDFDAVQTRQYQAECARQSEILKGFNFALKTFSSTSASLLSAPSTFQPKDVSRHPQPSFQPCPSFSSA